MTSGKQAAAEGLRMYDQLLAVHTIMRRGAELNASALHRLAAGERVDIRAAVGVARWLDNFTHHHHASEDELFWPLLRKLFPDAVASLDALTGEHERLDAELKALAAAIGQIEAAGRGPGGAVTAQAREGAAAADAVLGTLTAHLDTEEPVLKDLFPQTPPDDILLVRKAIIAGSPKSRPELVLGLLEDPVPASGYAALIGDLPAPVRVIRPLLVRRYSSFKAKLLG